MNVQDRTDQSKQLFATCLYLRSTLALPVIMKKRLTVWVHVGVVGLLRTELQVLRPRPHPVSPAFNDGLQSDKNTIYIFKLTSLYAAVKYTNVKAVRSGIVALNLLC